MSRRDRASVVVTGVLIGTGAFGCASGPHPALVLATKDLACEQKALKLHEIFPRKVKVEGCGKDATYVNICAGYGIESKCDWQRKNDL